MVVKRLTEGQANELRECIKDSVYWLTTYCYLKHTSKGKIPWDSPYDYQVRTMRALQNGEDVFVLKSRRVGASWIICAFVLWLCMFHPDASALLLSRKEFYAKGLLKRIRFILKNLPAWMRPKIGVNTQSELSFVFAHGDDYAESNIISLTTTDESGRGEDAMLVFMDEAAFIPSADDTWAAVGPTASFGGQRAVVSTPNGIGGFFHRIISQLQAGLDIGFTYITAHWEKDCGLSKEWLKKATVGFSLQQVLQEFELKFLSTGRPFFDLVKLEQCYKPPAKYPDVQKMLVRTEFSFSGVDTSEGHPRKGGGDADYHSICTLNEYGVQIIAFNDNRMPRNEFTGHVMEVDNGQDGVQLVKVEGLPTKIHREYPGGMAIEIWGSGDVTAQMHQVPADEFSYMVEHRQTNSSKMRILNSLRLAVNELAVVITDPFTYQCMSSFEDQTSGAVEKAGAAEGAFDDPVITIALAWMLLKRHGGQIYNFTGMNTTDGRRMVSVSSADDVPLSQISQVLPVGRIAQGPIVDRDIARGRNRRMSDAYENVRQGKTRMRPPGMR